VEVVAMVDLERHRPFAFLLLFDDFFPSLVLRI
jgi:hypothetical protein